MSTSFLCSLGEGAKGPELKMATWGLQMAGRDSPSIKNGSPWSPFYAFLFLALAVCLCSKIITSVFRSCSTREGAKTRASYWLKIANHDPSDEPKMAERHALAVLSFIEGFTAHFPPFTTLVSSLHAKSTKRRVRLVRPRPTSPWPRDLARPIELEGLPFGVAQVLACRAGSLASHILAISLFLFSRDLYRQLFASAFAQTGTWNPSIGGRRWYFFFCYLYALVSSILFDTCRDRRHWRRQSLLFDEV